jgi:hypothetical protein
MIKARINTRQCLTEQRLLLKLRKFTGRLGDMHVFRGFDGRSMAKSHAKSVPGPELITYDQYLRFLGLWFIGVLGISLYAFHKQFAT